MKIKEVSLSMIPLILMCAFFLFESIAFPAHDFANYYFGGHFLAHGKFTSDIYFPYWFNKEIAALGYHNLFTAYAPNSPFLAIIFSPLSYLEPAAAKVIFNVISFILFLYSIVRIADFYKIKPYFLFLLPLLFYIPIKNNILFGQVYFILFFLLAEALLAYEKGALKKAAAFLALAIFLKVFPIIVVLLFIFRKQYQLVLTLLFFCLLILLASVAITGADAWAFYFSTVLPKAFNGEIATAFVDNYQSVLMFLKRLLIFDAIENPSAFFNSTTAFTAILIGFKVLLMAIGYYISVTKNNFSAFAYWITAAIILSPYGSTYTFLLLLFPLFYVLTSAVSNVKKMIFILCMFLINNLPLSLFSAGDFPLSFLRLFALIGTFILLINYMQANSNWNFISIIAIIPILAVVIFPKQKPSGSGVTMEATPVLVYDYTIYNNTLTYFYWDERGSHSKSVFINANPIVPIDLVRNQVYAFGKKVTWDKSNKLKPMQINGSEVIFLSDYERGTGFFTLRKIRIH